MYIITHRRVRIGEVVLEVPLRSPRAYAAHLDYRDGTEDEIGRAPFLFRGPGFRIDDVSTTRPGQSRRAVSTDSTPPQGTGKIVSN